jgi:MFS family permease
MPLLTSLGLLIYALVPRFAPQYAIVGLIVGTVVFSMAAGLGEVLLSPLVAAIPSEHPEKDMSLLHSLYGWGVVGSVLISSIFFLLFTTKNWFYLALFFACLPVIASILFTISPTPNVNTENNTNSTGGRGKIIALCVICIFLGSAAENTMTNWISGFMEKALQIPKAVGDIMGLAIFALLLAVTRVLYAKFSPDISKTLLISMIGAAVCYIVAGSSSAVVLSFIACILLGVFTSMLWPGTLILMEQKIHAPGVAAYALMAASGDMGASVAPQLMGIIVDKVSSSRFATELSQTSGMTPDEIGLRTGTVITAVFPILGTLLLIYIIRSFSKKDRLTKKADRAA